jgi:hypothetical protein
MNAAVFAAVLIAIAIGLKLFVNASPAAVAATMRKMSAWVVFGLAGVLALRGQVALAAPLLVVGTILLRKFGGLGAAFPGGPRSEGQKSRVRTRILAMELDHDTGAMDGEVLSGEFAGRQLSSLDLDELTALYRECEAAGPQTSALLAAYLDRVHPEWRELEGVAAADEPQVHTGGTEMTREEAFEILGLAYGATREEIRKAHRALMKQFHPDQGGSSYLASKINQAKDLLLEQ